MGAIETFQLQPSLGTRKDTMGTFLCYGLKIKKKTLQEFGTLTTKPAGQSFISRESPFFLL
jgi:hypothetical protein